MTRRYASAAGAEWHGRRLGRGGIGKRRYFLSAPDEGVDRGRAELRTAAGDDFGKRLVDGPGGLVGPVRAERVEHVSDGDDAQSLGATSP